MATIGKKKQNEVQLKTTLKMKTTIVIREENLTTALILRVTIIERKNEKNFEEKINQNKQTGSGIKTADLIKNKISHQVLWSPTNCTECKTECKKSIEMYELFLSFFLKRE